jgi:hypothetical protein
MYLFRFKNSYYLIRSDQGLFDMFFYVDFLFEFVHSFIENEALPTVLCFFR